MMSDDEPKNEKPKKADKPAEERKTPAEWAVECGHFNQKPRTASLRPSAKTMRAWIFDSTKVHAGWGTRVASDVKLTRAEYEAAVAAACNISLG
jgi:hypothetical protein